MRNWPRCYQYKNLRVGLWIAQVKLKDLSKLKEVTDVWVEQDNISILKSPQIAAIVPLL